MRVLTIVTPAADPGLLTIDQLRDACGVAGAAHDAALIAMGRRISAAISAECNIAIGAGAVPTLRRETVIDTCRMVRSARLLLLRRHEVEISSIVVDGTALDVDDYVVDPESGLIAKFCSDEPVPWCASKVVVTYAAGFDTIPGDLEQAARDFARLTWLERNRDPSVKGSETEVPGVLRQRTDYWAGSVPGQAGEGPVPDVVAGQLARFRNFAMG